MEQVQQLSERRDDVAAAVSALAGIDAVLWQGGSEQLGPLFRQLDDLGRAVEAARVAVLAEAIERGETTKTMARAHTGWILEWAPSLRAGGAGQLLAVTRAATQQRHAQLREALLSGRVPVRAAAVCVEEMDRIRHRLTPEAVPSVWQALLSLAAEDGPRAVRRLRPALLARYGQAGELDRDQERAKVLVALSQPMHGGDGLFDYTLRLDVEAKTVLEAALGPLSAPRPADGVPDLRPAAQRRGQALIELVRRAVSCPGSLPTAAKATLLVTIGWQDLLAELGAGTTIASSDAGTLLGPAAIRRLACDAGIIPAVLGTDGQVLDLGRESRWFTPAQAKALWLRDRACTIPGCSMPAQWCDAHHLWHFADGGPTDLAHAALLCGYHHTWVHRHRLAGRVHDGNVTWDLTPGSYDSYLSELTRHRPDPPNEPGSGSGPGDHFDPGDDNGSGSGPGSGPDPADDPRSEPGDHFDPGSADPPQRP